jgi:hypothetical protein
MALWLYATLEGVGSARQLAGLCKDHVAYRWICGGVSVNHHTLSDFRTAHPEVLDDLLTHSVATLMHEGVDVVNTGSDQGQMPPMVEQHEQRYGKVPDETLVDGGFATLQDIEKVASGGVGTTVYAPVQKPRKPGRDPHQPLPGDSATIAEWRQRMGTPEAKQIYKERSSTAECVNAISRLRNKAPISIRAGT